MTWCSCLLVVFCLSFYLNHTKKCTKKCITSLYISVVMSSSDFTFSIWIGSTGADSNDDLPALIPLSDLWSVPSTLGNLSSSSSSSSVPILRLPSSSLPSSSWEWSSRSNQSQWGTTSQSATAASTAQTSTISYTSSTDNHVICQTQYNVTDFNCCVCFEPMYHEVWQCSLGLHHVCGSCHTKIGNRCPIERSSGAFIPDPRWKHVIQTVRQPCEQCQEQVFPWLMTDHLQDNCRMRKVTCPICTESHSTVVDHIRMSHPHVTLLEESKEEVIYVEEATSEDGYRIQCHTLVWDTNYPTPSSKWMVLREKHNDIQGPVASNVVTFVTLPSIVGIHLPLPFDHYTFLTHLDVKKGNMVECPPKYQTDQPMIPYEIVQFHDGFLTMVCRPKGHTCSHQTSMFCILNDIVYRLGTHCNHDQLAPACPQCL